MTDKEQPRSVEDTAKAAFRFVLPIDLLLTVNANSKSEAIAKIKEITEELSDGLDLPEGAIKSAIEPRIYFAEPDLGELELLDEYDLPQG